MIRTCYCILTALFSGLFSLAVFAERPDLSGLTPEERESIDMACLQQKVLQGPAAYNNCIRHQISMLSSAPPRPNLTNLAPEERQSIYMACLRQKALEGPASYNRCLERQLSLLLRGTRHPDLSGLNSDELHSIEMVCFQDKALHGPAVYNECLRRQLALLNEPIRENPPATKYNAPATVPSPPRQSPSYPAIATRAPAFVWPRWQGGAPVKKPLSQQKQIDPVQLFKAAAPSVYIVLAAASREQLVNGVNAAQGSGVAISKSRLLTNCHVLEGRSFIIVIQKTAFAPAEIEKADPSTDRCILKVSGQELSPIPGIRPWSTLEVGEKVYSIGTPSGLEQTLGEGIVSGLREYKGMHLVQTTAPISPGSSGGGLFDSKGNLVGITTFLLQATQALNFALLAEMYWQ